MKDFQPHLEPGWGWEPLGLYRYVLKSPQDGFATIDYVKRGWALGYGSFVSERSEGAEGRGWQLLICNRAKEALKKIYKDEK